MEDLFNNIFNKTICSELVSIEPSKESVLMHIAETEEVVETIDITDREQFVKYLCKEDIGLIQKIDMIREDVDDGSVEIYMYPNIYRYENGKLEKCGHYFANVGDVQIVKVRKVQEEMSYSSWQN